MILMPATTPNSFSTALLVSAKTAKPMAAVILQKSVTTPILLTISTRASVLSEVERSAPGASGKVEERRK